MQCGYPTNLPVLRLHKAILAVCVSAASLLLGLVIKPPSSSSAARGFGMYAHASSGYSKTHESSIGTFADIRLDSWQSALFTLYVQVVFILDSWRTSWKEGDKLGVQATEVFDSLVRVARLADAADPESRARRKLQRHLTLLLRDSIWKHESYLRDRFLQWGAVNPLLQRFRRETEVLRSPRIPEGARYVWLRWWFNAMHVAARESWKVKESPKKDELCACPFCAELRFWFEDGGSRIDLPLQADGTHGSVGADALVLSYADAPKDDLAHWHECALLNLAFRSCGIVASHSKNYWTASETNEGFWFSSDSGQSSRSPPHQSRSCDCSSQEGPP